MDYVEIHFLNVGHGDCTFIDHASRRVTMLDVNNSKSLPEQDEIALAASRGLSLSAFKAAPLGKRSWEDYYQSLLVDPYDYYKSVFGGRTIFRYIQTHPDLDHMSGLHRFFWQERVPLINFWDAANTKSLDQASFDSGRYDWNDWLTYKWLQAGKYGKEGSVTALFKSYPCPDGDYWTRDGLVLLSPTPDLQDYCNKQDNWNNASYVFRLDYGGRRVILPGDAEKPAWDSIEAYAGEPMMDCDILKAAHHGRENGYSQSAVAAMDPSIVICSVGKKPDTDASEKYRAVADEVLSTRFQGTIKVRIWEDGETWVYNSKNEQIASLPIL